MKTQEYPFKIQFEFPLNGSDVVLPLKAIVQLHRSDPYYRISGFEYVPPANRQRRTNLSLLPPQEIRLELKGGKRTWVHLDSGKETLLSMAIGLAIDRSDGSAQ